MSVSSKIMRLADASRLDERSSTANEPEALVRALRNGEEWAERAFVEHETPHVERIMTRILGWHAELDDLTQDVFTRAFARVDELREAGALRSWVGAIAVFVAREAIRRKRRRRWLIFLPADGMPEIPAPSASPEARAALRVFYEVVSTLDPDTRIAFTLRCVDGMELAEIAEICEVSLATIKRRIKRGVTEFYARGRSRAELIEWFEEGTRWRRIES